MSVDTRAEMIASEGEDMNVQAEASEASRTQ